MTEFSVDMNSILLPHLNFANPADASLILQHGLLTSPTFFLLCGIHAAYVVALVLLVRADRRSDARVRMCCLPSGGRQLACC